MKNYEKMWSDDPKLKELTLTILDDIVSTRNYCYDNGMSFLHNVIDYDISTLDEAIKGKIVPCLASCFSVINECNGWQVERADYDHIKIVPKH